MRTKEAVKEVIAAHIWKISEPTRLAINTLVEVDHWFLSMVAACVRVIANERIVPSIPAKKVVMVLISCSLSSHTCTTFVTAFLLASSSPVATAVTAALRRAFFCCSRRAFDIGIELMLADPTSR